MNNSREKILRTLLTHPGSTINDLAEAVGINSISIRHHLINLEADNLVSSEEERHGVGRPRLIYRLTEKGVEEFPTNYLKLTKRLLNYLRQNKGTAEVTQIFRTIGEEIAESYETEIKKKTLKERITLIKEILKDEGFLIEVKKHEDTYILTSLSCPYYRLRKEFPEICILDQTLISKLLLQPLEISSCIFEGADHCVYHIQTESEEDHND